MRPPFLSPVSKSKSFMQAGRSDKPPSFTALQLLILFGLCACCLGLPSASSLANFQARNPDAGLNRKPLRLQQAQLEGLAMKRPTTRGSGVLRQRGGSSEAETNASVNPPEEVKEVKEVEFPKPEQSQSGLLRTVFSPTTISVMLVLITAIDFYQVTLLSHRFTLGIFFAPAEN